MKLPRRVFSQAFVEKMVAWKGASLVGKRTSGAQAIILQSPRMLLAAAEFLSAMCS